MKYYTYIYFDPSRNNEPIYVGKGSGKRSLYHLSRKKTKHPFIQRLGFMKRLGIEPFIQIVDGLDEDCAYQMEMDFIAFFGRKDLREGTLLNLTNGGGRNLGAKLSDDHKRKIGEKSRGRPKTEETRKKLSIGVAEYLSENKRIWDEGTKKKISDSLKGKPHSAERKAAVEAGKQRARERKKELTDVS